MRVLSELQYIWAAHLQRAQLVNVVLFMFDKQAHNSLFTPFVNVIHTP